MDDLAAFGAGVRALRLRKGLSQEDLAELSELDQTYVSGVERGRRNLGFRNVVRIARALDIAASALVAEGEGLTAGPSAGYVCSGRRPERAGSRPLSARLSGVARETTLLPVTGGASDATSAFERFPRAAAIHHRAIFPRIQRRTASIAA